MRAAGGQPIQTSLGPAADARAHQRLQVFGRRATGPDRLGSQRIGRREHRIGDRGSLAVPVDPGRLQLLHVQRAVHVTVERALAARVVRSARPRNCRPRPTPRHAARRTETRPPPSSHPITCRNAEDESRSVLALTKRSGSEAAAPRRTTTKRKLRWSASVSGDQGICPPSATTKTSWTGSPRGSRVQRVEPMEKRPDRHRRRGGIEQDQARKRIARRRGRAAAKIQRHGITAEDEAVQPARLQRGRIHFDAGRSDVAMLCIVATGSSVSYAPACSPQAASGRAAQGLVEKAGSLTRTKTRRRRFGPRARR